MKIGLSGQVPPMRRSVICHEIHYTTTFLALSKRERLSIPAVVRVAMKLTYDGSAQSFTDSARSTF